MYDVWGYLKEKLSGGERRERKAMGDYSQKNRRADLLEEIAAEMGCQYLSDLRDTEHRKLCYKVILQIPFPDYTIAAWNDAFSYIIGEKVTFERAEEAKERLLVRLSEKK